MKEVNTEVPKKDLHSCPIKKEFLKIGGWMNEMGEENEGKRKFGVTGLSGESAIKRKGQNKNRKNTHSKDKIKLCHSKVKNGDCKLGSQCQDSHDIKVYMESKEPDIGPNCFLFDTFGFCKYGVTCRYANAHLSNMENVKNLEIFDEEQFGKEVKCIIFKWLIQYFKIKNAMKPGFQKSIRNKIKTKSEVVLAVTEFVEQKTKINSEKTDLLREIKALKESSDVENDELNKKKKRLESLEEELKEVKLTSREKVKLDFKGKTYLAPLTTVGNLPFRRICKEYGVDITCGEMALSQHLLQGNSLRNLNLKFYFSAQKHEWALAKRHKSETFFGLQICGNDALLLSKTCDLINDNLELDFVDLNLGCPIDSVVKSGAGSALLGKSSKLHTIIQSMQHTLDIPLTLKIRTGIFDNKRVAHKLVEQFKGLNISNVTLHGRSQQQR
ncbi:tRNA-dihydrouridine(47) synthase [NAD(P)(+)]-like protein [Clydaea vesicula]|uniref:tRNA-dihydrouridine(47) synthase [NAD(P)(+)] n=1 Tax=Clydaea vesicula TaxID=447962 RepID=A0AAD5U3U8_9FUNG|nr:tRNA-dihydrouridine(47) synthase [NAD(P)(+)]-like protein [Clydaea vesicula]